MDASTKTNTSFPDLSPFVFPTAILCLTFGMYKVNYLLFHTFVEMFSVVVACAIFIVAWNTQKIIKNTFILFLGMAYLLIAGLDFVHTVTYSGMGIFPHLSANEPTQTWVATRFIESVVFLVAPLLIHRRGHPRWWAAIFVLVGSATLAFIFVWPVMPRCFVPGQGLTPFKIGSEMVIVLILLASILNLYRRRADLDHDVWQLLCMAIAMIISAEMAFTLYKDVYGFSNMSGHYFKLISVFLVYRAIIKAGLIRPHNLAIQALRQKETTIQENEAIFKTIINASTDIVVLLDNQLCFMNANKAAINALGLKPNEIVGRSLADILPNPVWRKRLDCAEKVLADGQPVQYEEQEKDTVLINSIYPISNEDGQIVQLAIFSKDITKQRDEHQALVESVARFRMLAERIEEVFWIAQPDGRRFFYVSPAYETISGKSREDLYRSSEDLVDLIHPDDRLEIQKTFQKLPMDEWRVEFRMVRPSGAIRWIQNRGYSIKDDLGQVVQICGVASDITDRKNLEQYLLKARHELEQRVDERTYALSVAIAQLKHQVTKRTRMSEVIKEKHSMLDTLLQAIPDRVSFKDTTGCYQIVNNAFKAFFGLKGRHPTGLIDSDFKSSDMARISREKDHQVLQQGQPLRYESHLPSRSGISHWDVYKLPVKDSNGGIVGILSLSRDITDYKQREAQLRQSKATLQAFLDGISDPMVMMDQNLRLVYINRAAALAFPGKDGQGRERTCHGLLCNGRDACSECFIPTSISQKERHSFERARTGEPERIEKVDIYPLSQDRDGLDGAIVRILDITQAKQVERQMLHSEKMASLGMLVSGIAHEINNPNSFITFNMPILKAYLETIFDALDVHPGGVSHQDWFGMDYSAFRKEVFSLLDNLSHGSIRIDNIVSNLKAMTHPRPPGQNCKRFDIQGIIEKAVTLCRGEIRKRVKTLAVEKAPFIIEAFADPEGLEQVLINLLINASHAADKSDSWIKLRTRVTGDDNSFAIIEVHDNGCGMEPTIRDSVFDPFFTTKAPGVGTGLGLSVSYNLIGQMGGQISVESTPGQGAVFTVKLPLGIKKEVPDNMGQNERQGAY